MIFLILSAILIGLVVLEINLYKKDDMSFHKIKLLTEALIAFLFFLISYFITDTTVGVLYVFFSISIGIFISLVNYRANVDWFKYLSNIIGLPVMACLLIKAIENMLINPQYILILLLIINSILGYSHKHKGTKKENIALVTGILITIALMFFYSKASGTEGRIMLKQEFVARKYLEEELNIYGAHVYADRFSIKLKGEDITVKAHDSSGALIKMVYKNSKIINYDIKNSSND